MSFRLAKTRPLLHFDNSYIWTPISTPYLSSMAGIEAERLRITISFLAIFFLINSLEKLGKGVILKIDPVLGQMSSGRTG